MGYDHLIKKGSTSQIIEVFMRSGTTGQGLTGIAFGSITISYVRRGAASATSVTPVSGTLGTFVSSGWVEISGGRYQFSVPNAALASGVDGVRLLFTATGAIDKEVAVALVAFDPQDANALGLAYLSGDAFARLGVNGAGLTAVGDTAGTTTLLSRLTSARAGYLDVLNGLVAAIWAAVVDSSGVTTLLSRLTGTRAGYLDNLNGVATTANQTTIISAVDTVEAGIAALEVDVAVLQTSVDTVDNFLDTEVATINTNAATAATQATAGATSAATAATQATTAATQSTAANTAASAVKVVTDKLVTSIEQDGGVYRFTTNALEQSPAGGGGATAEEVWEYGTRTLTQSAASVAASVQGSTFVITAGVTFEATLTGLLPNTGYKALIWTLKKDKSDSDSASILQVRLNNPDTGGGLLYLNQRTPSQYSLTAADGEIIANSSTSETFRLSARASRIFATANDRPKNIGDLSNLYYDVKILTEVDGEDVATEQTYGTAIIQLATTHAVS